MSSSAIGCVGEETQLGVTITGSRLTRPRIVSKAALPLPTIMAARRVVTGTPAEARRSPASRRRRVGIAGAEPAEVDDRPHARGRLVARDRLRRRAILLLEIGRT